MQDEGILIVGAGAAGLMAAYMLSKAGRKVIVLEARDRIGGRIHTVGDGFVFKHAELGAEFVHGNLPVTMQIINDAGLEYISQSFEMWQYQDGRLVKGQWDTPGWDELMVGLYKLKDDIAIGEFLRQNFGEEKYDRLRESVTRFVSGYDTADPDKASALALREEWSTEDDDAQYRIAGGYTRIINYLAEESRRQGTVFYLNSIVTRIERSAGKVKVVLADGLEYEAEQVILALPLGVLQAGKLTFQPAIAKYEEAFAQIGFGAIVKLLLEFSEPFWEEGGREHMTFVMSAEAIPTWWTQYPLHTGLLTGWLGGIPAEKRKGMTDEEFLHAGIKSLAKVFDKEEKELMRMLTGWKIANWTTDPFTLGSYVYDMLGSHNARKVLSKPVDDKLYFAGEFIYEGPSMGTVEAALTSGLEVAKKII
ncbi:MAG TPA: NAD(P)/FAD-dependent oxidoreductase [Mucilaginibacter sp.]|nr:NAD(P)/FAD-dependent oxidoreductase [Mucilaginibacter sp.]